MSLGMEILISALLVIGGCFGLIGSFGLLKLRGAMQRLHAPTKATTVGVGASLIGAALATYAATGVANWQGVLVAAFLFLTAPLSGLMLAKAHRHLDRTAVPPTGTGAPWAGERPSKTEP
ncbi:cation:proton antiporter [Cypionkella sinensis]|uniref:Cation:proton antiporter n=1 Tax=Cypionkella sinensis TaxID=1756043 RepID=A0ABV7J6V0_9RHOB